MNPQATNTAVKVFNVIENGELTTLAISNYQKLYDENFLRKHKFGQQAMDQGEAPIKMVVVLVPEIFRVCAGTVTNRSSLAWSEGYTRKYRTTISKAIC